MNLLLTLIAVVVILAIMKAVVAALVVALFLALAISFATRPRAAFMFLGCLGLFGLASTQPLACIIALGVVGAVVAVVGSRSKVKGQPLLTDGRTHHSK